MTKLKAYHTVHTQYLGTEDRTRQELAAHAAHPLDMATVLSDDNARLIASWYKDGNPNLALLAKGKKFRIPDLRDEILEGSLSAVEESAMLHWLDLQEWLILDDAPLGEYPWGSRATTPDATPAR